MGLADSVCGGTSAATVQRRICDRGRPRVDRAGVQVNVRR